MSTLAQLKVLDIVADLARGRSTMDVAGRHRIPVQTVIDLRNEHGPDLGQLAKATEKMRKDLNRPAVPDSFTDKVLDRAAVDVLDRAEKIPALAAKVAKVRALLAEISAGIDAAEQRAAAEALVARARAEYEKAQATLAKLKGTKAAAPASDAGKVRAWAKLQGITVGANGRVPQAVVDQYEARS